MLGPKAVFLWYKSYNSSTFFQWLWRWETLKKITHLPLIVLLDTEPFSFSNSSLSRLRTKMTQRCAGSTERAPAMTTARRLHWASADEHDGRVRLHPQPRSSPPDPRPCPLPRKASPGACIPPPPILSCPPLGCSPALPIPDGECGPHTSTGPSSSACGPCLAVRGPSLAACAASAPSPATGVSRGKELGGYGGEEDEGESQREIDRWGWLTHGTH